MRLTGFDAAAMLRMLQRFALELPEGAQSGAEPEAPAPAPSGGTPPRRDVVTLIFQAVPELPGGTRRGIYSLAGKHGSFPASGETAGLALAPSHSVGQPAAMFGIEGLLAGRTLVERYRVDEVIARGGMGAVYRGTDLRLGREVAIKVVTVAAADAQGHERLRARFHREARAAAGLHHPHVVAVFDFGTDPALQLDFLVMELLRGEDLASAVNRRGHPNLPAALEILHQAGRGLAAGHRAGLIHRDVKPGNLFLEAGDRPSDIHVKVLDFGIAEITADDQTITHLTVAGRSPYSPAYASPEQLRGDVRLTPATDVFSLGAVAFQLVTGRRVFASLDARQAVVEVSQSLAALPKLVPGLPATVRSLLQRALAPHPEDRFPDAGVFAEAVGQARGDSRHRAEWDPGLSAAPPLREDRDAREPREGRAPGLEEGRGSGAAAPRSPSDRWGAPPLPYEPGVHHTPEELSRLTAEVGAILQRGPGSYPGAPPPARAAAPERSWLSRAASTLWSFALTAASLVLFVGCWWLVVTGLESGEQSTVIGAGAASVVLTPFMLHRLLGRRGSFRFALLASLAATVGSVYFLARAEELETVLVIMLAAQVTLSLAAEWLTQRPRPVDDPLDSLPPR